jgi:hypothetical protein
MYDSGDVLGRNRAIISKRDRDEMQLLSRKMTVVRVPNNKETRTDVRVAREMVRGGNGRVADDGLRHRKRTMVLG